MDRQMQFQIIVRQLEDDSGLKNQDKILQILFPIIKLHF